MSTQINANTLVSKTLKFLLNFLVWFFIIPAIIDIIRYINEDKLITDSLFGAKRASKDRIVYFGFYVLYALTWALFGIGLIIGIIYIIVKGENWPETFTGTKTTFSNKLVK